MVSCAATTTALLTDYGDLYTFGRGGDGRLGVGDARNRWEPTRVKFPANSAEGEIKCMSVSTGANHSAVVTEDGGVYTFGRGNHGQLGLGDALNRLSPERVELEGRVKIAACGHRHTLAVVHVDRSSEREHVEVKDATEREDVSSSNMRAEVWAWGSREFMGLQDRGGEEGEAGGGEFLGGAESEWMTAYKPVRLECFNGLSITVVACGHAHSVAVTAGGVLWTWGLGLDGRLGHGDTRNALSPRAVRASSFRGGIVMAACGSAHTASIDDEGRLYTWGANASGALGIGICLLKYSLVLKYLTLSTKISDEPDNRSRPEQVPP